MKLKKYKSCDYFYVVMLAFERAAELQWFDGSGRRINKYSSVKIASNSRTTHTRLQRGTAAMKKYQYIEDITRQCEDMNFICKWWKQNFTNGLS